VVFASTADRETALTRGRVTLFGRACTLAEGGGGGGEGRPLSSVEGRGGAATAVEVLLESALTVRAAHPSRGGMALAPPRPAVWHLPLRAMAVVDDGVRGRSEGPEIDYRRLVCD
jgi:hypothetical protein